MKQTITLIITLLMATACFKTDINSEALLTQNGRENPSLNFHVTYPADMTTHYYGVEGVELATAADEPQYLFPFNTCISKVELFVSGTPTTGNFELFQNGGAVLTNSISGGWNSFYPNIYINANDKISISVNDTTGATSLEIEVYLMIGCNSNNY